MMVSVIIPYFKKKKYIKKTINSILSQSYQSFEIIIINDEPGNISKKILYDLKKIDKRIKIINNKINIGAGFSRNKGIKFSKGKYIAFIDSDDLWKKNKLKIQIKEMEKFNYNITHTSYDIINKRNKKLALRTSKKLNYDILKKSCDIGLSTVIIKKNILKNKKLFSNFKTKEDYFFWLKLAKSGYIFNYINKSLSQWRITNNSLSSSTLQKIFDSYRVYSEHEKNFIISFFRTIILSLNFLMKKLNDYRY